MPGDTASFLSDGAEEPAPEIFDRTFVLGFCDQERAAGRARLDAMFEDGWQSGISDASLDEVRETARRLAATGVRRAV